MKYILFIFLQTHTAYSSAPYIHSETFGSERACVSALQVAQGRMANIWRRDEPTRAFPNGVMASVELFCIPAGKP